MTELYSNLQLASEIEELFASARELARAKRHEQAIKTALAALLHTHAHEDAYSRVVKLLAELFAERGNISEALTLAWYAGDRKRQEALVGRALPGDRARTYALWAVADPKRASELHRNAAGELEKAGMLVRAAIAYEKATDFAAARTLWSRLGQMLDARRDEYYAAGLARFNVARTSRATGDDKAAREATVAAVHRLEEAADRFESIGQRERAFDCFHVLIAIGQLQGAFEHVLEGSVNAIRILSEDNLRYHALRTYEHGIVLAERASEYAAAATLAREMTEYARKHGLTRLAARGMQRQSELWERVAKATAERKGPPELTENALVASLLASAEAGQYSRVGALYRQLGELDLEAARCEHYARAAKRYHGASDEPLDAAPLDQRLGEHVAPPDVWHVDLVEWEEHGSAAEACADVVLDSEEQGERITRRSALVARLIALDAESAPWRREREASVVLADHLAPIGLYVLLSPLERLFASRDAEVRRAAVRALGRYFYKRTFVTLEQALRDPDRHVVDEATKALERLRFDHAFDPLSRIYRTTTRSDVRIAALRALARLDVLEAAELMLGVMEHGGPEERDAAIQSLKAARGARFVDSARAALPHASARLRSAIREVFRARNIAA